jgi:hypothetical protein
MKEQLIQLAKEKEFDYHIPSIDHWGHPNEERWYYFYMCEVQKWLREKHEIYLAVVKAYGLYGIKLMKRLLKLVCTKV